jgi:N-acetylglucosaminyldiphosphoundecaprenol N-acetyl-beta-D-mannosaminyltransferase
MQRGGLEWLFRLGTEPRRLGPRYLTTNTLFLLRLAAQKLGLRQYPLS